MTVFTEISLIIVIAAVVAGFMRLLRQPLIIGHIITGLIVGPFVFDILKSFETIEIFSQIGIAFLLFIVGLSLSPHVFREVGWTSLLVGVGQIAFTSLAGFYISGWLGFDFIQSLYIAVALTFSSTIIVMKLLSDKGDLGKLYGKISVGFLLVQDIVAIAILLGVSFLSTGGNVFAQTGTLFLQGVLLAALLFLVSMNVLPRVSFFFARSQEFLFLFAVAWGLGLATLFNYLGFSIEIGALVAGITLSASPYHFEISSRMRPLRDFFIILFFILLGAQVVFGNIAAFIVPAILFSLFVLVGNPIIVMTIMGLLGYNKKTGFMAGLTVAQISEFSLILAALGVRLGHLGQDILSLITMIGFITIGASTYMIIYSDKIYGFVSDYLSVFERKHTRLTKEKEKKHDIILFGYNRVGYDFVEAFKEIKSSFLVVDFDPEVGKKMDSQEIPFEYGDADDGDFLDSLGLKKIKMAVSTIPDFDTNLLLVQKIRRANKRAIIIVISHNVEEAVELYKSGTTYVVLPHFLGGRHASFLVSQYKFDSRKFNAEKKAHIKHLKKREKLQHEHPRHEKDA